MRRLGIANVKPIRIISIHIFQYIGHTRSPTINQKLEVVFVEFIFCLADRCTVQADQHWVHKTHSQQRLLLTAVVTHHVSTPSAMVLRTPTHTHTHTHGRAKMTKACENKENGHVKRVDTYPSV